MARVRLRPVVPADSAAVSQWLPEAGAAIRGRGASVSPSLTLETLLATWSDERPGSETLAGVLSGGTVVGLMQFARADGVLHIHALTVQRDLRNLGYGQEMVFEAEGRYPDARVATATVPMANGLAVYFWLRTGYRPAYPTNRGGPLFWHDDGTLMLRRLSL